MMYKIIGFLLTFGITVSSNIAQAASDPFDINLEIPYTLFKLDNGLTLIVHEDHKAPIVAVNIWYHVGSKDEVRGKTGFAHLFEHLMFNGSENFDHDYFQATEKLGATTLNGTTNKDRTNYFQNVPKNALDSILWLESDRMGNLLGAITQEKLDEQRAVVQNEKRQHENSPYGKGAEIQYNSIYPHSHPYSWTVIGSMADLNAATLEDVHTWFKTYYGANNAVIVIAGDVNTAQVKDKIEHYFGAIEPGPPLTKQQAWVAKLTGTQKEISYDRVAETMLLKSWNIEGSNTLDTTYLHLVAAILSSGKNSRLYKRLVYDEQLVSSTSAYTSAGEIAGTWEITAMINPGVAEAKVDAILTEELNKFLQAGPTRQELKRVKIQTISSVVRSLENIGGFSGKSDVLAANYVYTGDPAHYKKTLNWIKHATRADLQRAAQKWLADGMYQLEIRPFPKLTTAAAKVDRSGLPKASQSPDINFAEFSTAKLDNGMQVIVAQRNAIPVIQMQLSLDVGYAADHTTAPGTTKLAMAMLDEGTSKQDALEINEALTLLGANLSAGSNLDTSFVNFSTLSTTIDTALKIFADVVLSPAFPDKEFTRLKLQQLNAIKREQTNPQSMALRIFPKLVYGKQHAYSNPFSGSGTLSKVQKITIQDLKQFHNTWFKANNATMIVVGDITLEAILPKLNAVFGHWQPGDVPKKPIDSVARAKTPRIYLLDRPGSSQSVIIAGHVAPPKANPDEIAIIAMNDAIGGLFTSRINTNLREDKGWSYGASTGLVNAREQRFFYTIARVQTDKTADSIREVMNELQAYTSSQPITPTELAKSQTNNTLTLAGRWETANAVLGSLAQVVQYSLGEDYFDTFASKIKQLSVDEVARVSRMTIHPESLVWVVVGDKKLIEQNLNQLGYGAVTLIDSEGNESSH